MSKKNVTKLVLSFLQNRIFADVKQSHSFFCFFVLFFCIMCRRCRSDKIIYMKEVFINVSKQDFLN